MSVKFTLRDDCAPISLFQPSSKASFDQYFPVEPGGLVEVPGDLAKVQPHDDAFVVVNGDEVRAWPKAMWNLAVSPTAPAAAKGK
jgi:hypothetical protein